MVEYVKGALRFTLRQGDIGQAGLVVFQITHKCQGDVEFNFFLGELQLERQERRVEVSILRTVVYDLSIGNVDNRIGDVKLKGKISFKATDVFSNVS